MDRRGKRWNEWNSGAAAAVAKRVLCEDGHGRPVDVVLFDQRPSTSVRVTVRGSKVGIAANVLGEGKEEEEANSRRRWNNTLFARFTRANLAPKSELRKSARARPEVIPRWQRRVFRA